MTDPNSKHSAKHSDDHPDSRGSSTTRKRVGIFGWGITAPQSANIEAFRKNLQRSDTWMTPFTTYGPNNFLVGQPEYNEAEVTELESGVRLADEAGAD